MWAKNANVQHQIWHQLLAIEIPHQISQIQWYHNIEIIGIEIYNKYKKNTRYRYLRGSTNQFRPTSAGTIIEIHQEEKNYKKKISIYLSSSVISQDKQNPCFSYIATLYSVIFSFPFQP